MRHSTVIKGYLVELATEGETGADTTECSISRGPYHTSLERLMAEGNLVWVRSNGHEAYEVPPPSVIGEIENWAYSNGY